MSRLKEHKQTVHRHTEEEHLAASKENLEGAKEEEGGKKTGFKNLEPLVLTSQGILQDRPRYLSATCVMNFLLESGVFTA